VNTKPLVAAATITVAVMAGPALVVAAAVSTASPTEVGVCGPAGPGMRLAGVAVDAEQLANAATITTTTARRHLPPRASVIALAVALQESSLRNITTSLDHDSLGLFQQRVRFYGASVAADPASATTAFLDRLVAVPDWRTRPLTEVAAAVQRPRADLAGAYARWEPLATALADRYWPTPPTMRATQRGRSATLGSSLRGQAAVVACAGVFGTGPGGGTVQTPAGLVPGGPQAARTAAAFALAQLGRPYVWGATGPGAYDCSGLTQAAWAHAGIAIPRVTYEQVSAGTPIPAAQARSGDLVFIAGSDGTPARPGHVGMVAGRDTGGVLWLVQAPQSGETVQAIPASRWSGLVVAIRRIR